MDIGERLLKPWEFWSDSFSGGVRTSLLIGESSWQETRFGRMITASVFAPEGRTLGNWRQDSVSLLGDTKVMDHARLLWSVSGTKDYDLGDLNSATSGSCFVLHAKQLHYIDGGDFGIDDYSVVLPLARHLRGEVRCLELFGGGWGGWSWAGKVLGSLGAKWIFGAVEIGYDMAKIYALNHGCPLIPVTQKLPAQALVHFPNGFVLNGDVMNTAWWEAAAHWEPEVIAISAPCPPWSNASSQAGLQSDKGRLLLKAIALCRVLRPRLILLEQVQGFAGHPHKKVIIKVLHWAGYQIKWQGSLDLNEILPVRRVRWLAIASRVHDTQLAQVPWQGWPARRVSSPAMIGTVHRWSEEVAQQLKVPNEALDTDPQVLLMGRILWLTIGMT